TASAVSQSASPVAQAASVEMADETIRTIDVSTEKIDTSIEVPAYSRCLIFLNKRLELTQKDKDHVGPKGDVR
ncbi:MAG: hypothetical protein AABZ44_07615, partial [Elusimicrobiota bacterium]